MDIHEHQFIALFDAEQAMQLSQQAVIETFADDAVIFEEGEVPDFLYLILDGEVFFRKPTAQGHYQVVGQAKTNDFFGEFGILDGQPRSAQAVVHEGATLARIPRNVLMELLNNAKGESVLQLFHFIVQRLRITTDEYVKQVAHKQKMVLLGEMMNTIIHDFKSPLSSIHLSGSMLREMYADDEDTMEWCELIQEQATRMTAMAEELLDFARGGSNLNWNTINLAKVLIRFERLNRIYLQQSKVALIIDCPPSLMLLADEYKLMRVFQNLVVNAVEAMQGQGGEIHLVVTQASHEVQIAIQDNGPGIPEHIQENFFEAFVTHGKKRGTGLGTAIAKSIIDAHKGRIHFETEPGKGTTFYINLPNETVMAGLIS
ncbi:MAG: cyclic nucleotide-binding domain-containing protein [Spirulina sp. SIO3F2]|nr:cyclic nucleotide-binding domain-containing protein [Spirulina sp. SIO3F2]